MRVPQRGGQEMEQENEPGRSRTAGLSCPPMPITMMKGADGPAAEEDIRRRGDRMGHEIVKFEEDDGGATRFVIRKMK